MNTNKKALLAVAMVALMLAVPFTVISDSEQADAASYWPGKVNYTYTVDFTTESNIIVKSGSNVMISPMDTGTEANVATLNGLASHDDTVYKLTDAGTLTAGGLTVAANNLVKYNSNSEVWVKCTAWTWNSSGVGPFGAFYAAISLGIEDEQALSTTPGHVAYILSPNDLTHAIKYKNGSTIATGDVDISSKLTDYNVMLVIPTVYWSVEDKVVTLSNAASTGAMAYAHQADGYIYPYLAIGVYEATADDTYGLLSKTGGIPTGNKDLPTFRTYVDTANQLLTDNVGTYQMWNLYEWTLYKLMAEAYISSVDSSAKAGGCIVGGSFSTAGAGNSAGPQSASDTGSYGKILIENAWGSVWDYIDNTFIKEGVLKAGSGLTNELSATTEEVSGQDYTGGQIAVGDGTSGNKIAEYSLSAASFGVPLKADDGSAVIPDGFWFNSSDSRVIIVGGYANNNVKAGLSTWYSNGNLSDKTINFGARLTYLMSADAAETGVTSHLVRFVEGNYITSVKVGRGSSVTLYDAPDTAEGTFAGWYFDREGTKPAGPTNGYYTPVENVTLYALYTPASETVAVTFKTIATETGFAVSYAKDAYVQLPVLPDNETGRFVGWSVEAQTDSEVKTLVPQTNYQATADAVLYAQYAALTGKVTATFYNASGTAIASQTIAPGFTTDANGQIKYNEGQVIGLPAYSESGYSFIGWYTAASDGSLIGAAGDVFAVTADTSFYARTAANVTVSFQDEDGSVITSETITTYAGQVITLPNYVASDDGYVLKGWYDSNDAPGSETILGTYGSKYTVSSAITFKAMTMQLSSGGGSVDVNNVVLGDYYEPSDDGWEESTKTPEELAALFDIVIPAEILPGTHGMIMITPNSNYVIDHIVVADNTGDDDEGFEATGVVVPLDKYRWMIQSVTGDVKINIYMKEDDGTSYGVKDFYISGLTGTPSNDGMTLNTGAVVKLIGDDSGLKAGSVSIKGTRYTVDDQGMRTYASFTTTLQDTVSNGDSEFVGSLSLGEDEGQIYCVYAEYTDNANNVPTFKMVTAQLLAPRAA